MSDKIKLFCLPYAGGSAKAIYDKWIGNLDTKIELHPIELAGRGTRIADNLYSNIEEAIDDVLEQIKNEIIDSDYAIFGHSMGSILTYEVLQRIENLRLPPPIYAFFSGRRAPHCPSRRAKSYSKMNELELEKVMIALGGTPPEFFNYPELKNMFIPIIKSDFKIADSLVEKSEVQPFNFDISIFIGTDEDVTEQESTEWSQHTTGNCSITYFQGGHFFLLDKQQEVVDTINKILIRRDQKIVL
ncbi:MAG: medium-chain acyl-[acyl-carrier-protein] hydrolase [Cyclobacteriaceae bacterium]|jgi:medium-chain acyl-[acyl-carrier-protein] hydrolase